MINNLISKYMFEIECFIYGCCMAFLGLFAITIPFPIGGIIAAIAHLYLFNEYYLNTFDNDIIPMTLIGFLLGSFVLSFFAPPIINIYLDYMLLGSFVGGLVSGVIYSFRNVLLQREKLTLLLIANLCYPILNFCSINQLFCVINNYLLLFGSYLLYWFSFSLVYIIKKELA